MTNQVFCPMNSMNAEFEEKRNDIKQVTFVFLTFSLTFMK